MTDIDILLARFIDEWNVGSRPVVETFLNQAAEADRDDLAANISRSCLRADASLR